MSDRLSDEGVIKYRCEWEPGPAPTWEEIEELARCRDRLRDMGLIGVTADGIGYGNASIRAGARSFLVTGTQTGAIERLRSDDVTLVREYDIASNWLTCVGPVRASSEALTHAAIYECSREIGAVVHGHSEEAWLRLRGALPTTGETVPYGTPEMGYELMRLYRESDLREVRVAVMGGHYEGLIAFGATVDEAARALAVHVFL